jgi:23S rRNA pseudouridine955/2504/2580 synthase
MRKKSIVIPREAGGMQAETLVRRLLPDLKESDVRKLFEKRDVKVDGTRVSRNERLSPGQEMVLFLPDEARAPELDVVYEDQDILLVNKRPGMPVEPAEGALSLTELCRRHAGDGFPPAPCHRLDIRTGGLCLFAKNQKALDCLTEAFRNRMLEKNYECLVRGEMKPPAAVCRAYLVKDAEKSRVRITDRPEPGAREIVTGYETLESGPVSRLKVRLYTGRTHQIRAHLASMGHPILGDDVYGDREFNRRMKTRGLKLCAVSLKLDTGGELPSLDGKLFEIKAPF